MAEASGHGDCRVHVLRDNGSAQQTADHALIFFVALHQLGGDADKAARCGNAFLVQRAGTNYADRQKGSAPSVRPFQIADRRFRRLFVRYDNLLHGASECNLNRDRILISDSDELGNRSLDATQSPALSLLHHHTDGLGEALVFALHLFKDLQLCSGRVQ